MTETKQAEQVKGALGGVVIALATLIAIFAFYTLARAQTPSANISGATGATAVNNGANSVIGASTTMPTPAANDTASTSVSGPSAAAASAPILIAPPPSAPAPMVISIAQSGSVLIRGVVTAVSGTTITLASWGGNWTVVTNADTSVTPGGVAGIQAGDFVGADGAIGTGPFTVNASVVRDWTTK